MIERVMPWMLGVLTAAWVFFLGWASVRIYGIAYRYLATLVDPMLLGAGQVALFVVISLGVLVMAGSALLPRPAERRSGISE